MRGRIWAYLYSKPYRFIKKGIDKVKQCAEALDLINSNEEILALPPIPDNSTPIEALLAIPNCRIPLVVQYPCPSLKSGAP
jgi:hypothetical protein